MEELQNKAVGLPSSNVSETTQCSKDCFTADEPTEYTDIYELSGLLTQGFIFSERLRELAVMNFSLSG